MRRRGEFTWMCLDCKAETRFERREVIRAAGLKCSSCGSRFVEPKTAEARSRMLTGEAEKRSREDDGKQLPDNLRGG